MCSKNRLLLGCKIFAISMITPVTQAKELQGLLVGAKCRLGGCTDISNLGSETTTVKAGTKFAIGGNLEYKMNGHLGAYIGLIYDKTHFMRKASMNNTSSNSTDIDIDEHRSGLLCLLLCACISAIKNGFAYLEGLLFCGVKQKHRISEM